MNILTYFNAMQPYIQGKSIYHLFPQEFIENLPFARFPPFHCIRCGCQMTPDMIMPPGRMTPRAICPNCWEKITAELTDECWICGDGLENHQLFRQEASPKDVHHRIHDVGKCRDYFSLVSARAIGQSTGILEENHFQANITGNGRVVGAYDDLITWRLPFKPVTQAAEPVIICEPREMGDNCISGQIPLKPATKAIPYEPRETVDDWLNQSGGTREKEKVNIVRMDKNHK